MNLFHIFAQGHDNYSSMLKYEIGPHLKKKLSTYSWPCSYFQSEWDRIISEMASITCKDTPKDITHYDTKKTEFWDLTNRDFNCLRLSMVPLMPLSRGLCVLSKSVWLKLWHTPIDWAQGSFKAHYGTRCMMYILSLIFFRQYSNFQHVLASTHVINLYVGPSVWGQLSKKVVVMMF